MSLPREFKSLEKELYSLEKEFNNFEKELNKTCNKVTNLRIDERKYNQKAIEKRLLSLIEDYKNNMLFYLDQLETYVDDASKKSLEIIQEKSNETSLFIDELNENLNKIQNLNHIYLNKEYEKSIEESRNLFENINDDKIKKYALIIELESYDNICKNKLENLNKDDFEFFEKYYLKCLEFNAKNHLILASEKLFLETTLLISNYSSNFELSKLYEMSNKALKCYSYLPLENKNKFLGDYNKLYSLAVVYFNKYSRELYESFEYLKVKEILNNIEVYKENDIDICFFKNKDLSAYKVFSYLKKYVNQGSLENIRLAFEDTRGLDISDNKNEYLSFWCSIFDKTKWEFIEKIIKDQDDKYSIYKDISNSFAINLTNINERDGMLKSFYDSYYAFLNNEDKINFNDFIDTTISINELTNLLYKKNKEDKTSLNVNCIKDFDKISFYMIKKNSKYCGYYSKEKIKILNKVLEDTSNRLFNKRKYKLISRNNKNNKDIKNLKVKFYTSTTNAKNKMIIFFVIFGVAFILILILILFMINLF